MHSNTVSLQFIVQNVILTKSLFFFYLISIVFPRQFHIRSQTKPNHSGSQPSKYKNFEFPMPISKGIFKTMHDIKFYVKYFMVAVFEISKKCSYFIFLSRFSNKHGFLTIWKHFQMLLFIFLT